MFAFLRPLDHRAVQPSFSHSSRESKLIFVSACAGITIASSVQFWATVSWLCKEPFLNRPTANTCRIDVWQSFRSVTNSVSYTSSFCSSVYKAFSSTITIRIADRSLTFSLYECLRGHTKYTPIKFGGSPMRGWRRKLGELPS